MKSTHQATKPPEQMGTAMALALPWLSQDVIFNDLRQILQLDPLLKDLPPVEVTCAGCADLESSVTIGLLIGQR